MLTPDPIIPDPKNPQSFNRYSYVLNQPTKYIDPSGHNWECPDPDGCGSGGSSSVPLPPPADLPPEPEPDPLDCLILQQCPPDVPLPLGGNPGWTNPYDLDIGHNGLDIISGTETALLALGKGTVVAVGEGSLSGFIIIVEYKYEDLPPSVASSLGLKPGQSLFVQYQHMAGKSPIAPGDIVSAGQVIGTMGGTGDNSSGPHLHVEIRVGESGSLGQDGYFYPTEESPNPWGSSATYQNWKALSTIDPKWLWPDLPEWQWG
jgi:murein DD-endopeptidase MepM/ murein hydrolase activator NlpD